MDEQIAIRLFAVQYNLEKLKDAYQETTRDALLDVGLQYGVKYTDNDWFEEKDHEYRSLLQRRQDILFTCILNFTQSFYSIKDYLKRLEPNKTSEIETFFSERDGEFSPRKQIANDMKHNPSKDITFDFKSTRREIKQIGNRTEHITYMKQSFFYGEHESVEYCTKLYKDLIAFIDKIFPKR